ncbi:DUF7283 family protein [Haloarcula halophila]|uniref:DUF7283 family protein n=1 Tax=Haloarcula TaxID=2237 RepID=UPI0023E46338|nr:hypothetical protein [Halomicroarcula sp. DFY41]
MFDAPIDTVTLWAGVGAVSVAVLTVIAQAPTTAPPAATATAAAVDEVTTSPAGSVERRPLRAQYWSLDGRQLGLQNEGGTSHATLHRVAIPAGDRRLGQVLDGAGPETVFSSPAEFHQAIDQARNRSRNTRWWSAPDRLTARHVAWGDVDVTLVG